MAARVSDNEFTFEIHELAIPQDADSPTWADFEAGVRLHVANEAAGFGTDDLFNTPIESLPDYLDDGHPNRIFVARSADRLIGMARYEIEPGDAPTTGWVRIDVDPDFRRRGVGSALSARLDSVAATDGLRKFIAYVPSPDAQPGVGEGNTVTAPTGFGSVPSGNPEVRFLEGAGYHLEQIARASRLALPLDVTARLVDARERSGANYALHFWEGATPAEWQSDIAMLHTRMSTEEPNAGLDEPEDPWSVERLVADENRRLSTGRTFLTVAVEDFATGGLIGYSTLSVPEKANRAVMQWDTLVLPEHRGHRLGMLLKVANIDYLQRVRPGHPSIVTFNAEENRYMLDVNEAVGFERIGSEGAWRKDLPA
jgi:GNAT superfamily N-acetyltransferase